MVTIRGKVACCLGTLHGLIDLGSCHVVDRDGETFLSNVEGEVLPHDCKASKADSHECHLLHRNNCSTRFKYGSKLNYADQTEQIDKRKST
jgi:hypothetical protein